MGWLVVKTLVSAVVVVAVSELARRSAALGALVASLPLVSVLGMAWLWQETGDTARLAAHAEATFWYVLPSLPMFLLLPPFLRAGVPFWATLGAGVALTVALYVLTTAVLARFGITL